MSPKEWLEANDYGYSELSGKERAAISDFSLLWTLFEARILDTNANAKLIREKVATADVASFAREFDYFRDRYFANGQFTDRFGGLNLRNSDDPELVRLVLSGTNVNPADQVATLFIIIYRLRNNLFHGSKWADKIKGQLGNFENANSALMTALNCL